MGLCGLVIWQQAARRWRDFTARTDALERHIAEAPPERPVLYGDAVDDDAWPHYTAAFAAVADPAIVGILQKLFARAVHPLRGRLAPVLGPLRRAAQSARIAMPLAPARGHQHPMVDQYATSSVVHLAVAAAREEVAAGHGEEAARLLLDAMQLGRDLAHSPRSVVEETQGGAALQRAGRAVGELLPRLDADARALLAEGLDRLAAGFAPVAPSIAGDLVLYRHAIDGDAAGELHDLAALGVHGSCWRFGLSTRLAAAMYGLRTADLLDELAATAPADQASRQRRAAAEVAAEAAGNPFARFARSGREWLARLQVVDELRSLRARLPDPQSPAAADASYVPGPADRASGR